MFGVVHTCLETKVQDTLLSKISNKLENNSIYIEDNVVLGYTSLNGESLGPLQQVTNNRYILVWNGALYNRDELCAELLATGVEKQSQTDAEIILNGYSVWGSKMLDKLNGVFAIIIYDREEHTLFVARDRFGVQPLYYRITDKEIVFASEIPTILAVMDSKPLANENAIFDYLVFNRTDQTEQTFFDGIYKLQHGCCMVLNCDNTYTKDTLPITKWYNLADKVQGKMIKKDKDKFMRLFVRAIQIRTNSNLSWGTCLSGGLDSSAITSTVLKVLEKTDLHTFSAVYGKTCQADESRYIDCFEGMVPNMHYVHPDADALFANLHNYVHIQVEPTPTTSPFAHYCVMQEAQKYVQLTLDGQGADEALSGYEYIPGLYYKTLLTRFKWITLAKELVRYTLLHKSIRHIKYMIFFLLPSRMRTRVRVAQRGYIDPKFANRHKNSVIADQLFGATTMQEMLIRHFEYKLEHLIKWGDRNARAFSMESRQPFLDKDLVEYSLMLEDSAKIHNGYTKYILREVMYGIMPEPVRMRVDKMGFAVPQDEWFRTEKFQKLVMELLTSESFAKRGFVLPEEAIQLYQKHLAGKVNVSKDIWKWINLELWFREYID
jgi:asparagine synthase (glutamine-hydrolysing)